MKTTLIIIFGSFISLLIVVGIFAGLYAMNPAAFGGAPAPPMRITPVKEATADTVTAVSAVPKKDTLFSRVTENIRPKEPKKPVIAGDTTDWKSKAKLFEAMNVDAASSILKSMSDKEVKKIMPHIKKRNAAKILASFDPERAARIIR